MPNFSRREELLLAQKAKIQEVQDAQKQKQALIDAKLKRLYKQQAQHRKEVVANLVEAAGLLWVEDGVLEKFFTGLAETLPFVATHETNAEGT